MIDRRLKVVVITGLILLFFLLSGCSTMEEKRDNYFAQGKELYQKEDYQRARIQFKNAVQADPKFAEGRLWLGKTEIKLKKFKQAFGSLTQAVELNPNLTEAQILLGQFLLAGKQIDKAEEKAKLALEQEPKNPEALLLSATLALAKEQPQNALEILAEVRRLDPSKIDAYLLQAAVEAKKQNPGVAAATLEAGIKANPQALALYLALAQLADSQKQFDRGEEALLKAVALEPKNSHLQLELARHYIKAGHLDKAEQALRQRMILEPDNEAHAAELAKFLAGRGQVKEAEKVLTDFVSQHPDNYNIRFALAEFYLSRTQEGSGQKVLREIIARDPEGPNGIKAKGQLAGLRLARGRVDEAATLVGEVLKANPKDAAALQTRALIALGKGQALEAVNDLRIVTQDQPKNEKAWLLLARAHLLNKEKEQAKEKARQALELKPDYLDARRFLYGLYLESKDYDGAIQTIQKYLNFNDKDVFNLISLGEVYAFKGDSQKARSTFQKVIDLDPKNPEGYFQQARLSLALKKPEEAVKFAETALVNQPNFLPALRLLVAVYREQKQPDKALEAVRQVLKRSPDNPQLHQMLGEVLLAQKQPQAAVAPLEEALKLNPRQAPALQLLAMAYREQPNQDQVLRQLEERVADPKAPPYFALVLSTLYERQQKFDKAIELYDNLITRNLFPELARNNLAYLLAEHRATPENLKRALKLSSETLEEHPDEKSFMDTMGWILCKQGEFAQARTYLEKAASQSSNPSVFYHLGWCAAKLGDNAKARETLQKALESKGLFPERETAEKLLKSLPSAEKPQ